MADSDQDQNLGPQPTEETILSAEAPVQEAKTPESRTAPAETIMDAADDALTPAAASKAAARDAGGPEISQNTATGNSPEVGDGGEKAKSTDGRTGDANAGSAKKDSPETGKAAGADLGKEKARTIDPDLGGDAGKVTKDPFAVLQDAVNRTNHSWKQMPQGDEREANHKLWLLAEDAYISAGLKDKDRADSIWKERNGKEPKLDLQERLKATKEAGGEGRAVSDLTGSLNKLAGERDYQQKIARSEKLQMQVGQWVVAKNDAKTRAIDARQRATSQLMTPEPNQNDTGLHLLKSFTSGWGAATDLRKMMNERRKGKDIERDIGGSESELRDAQKFIIEFKSKSVPSRDQSPTMGQTGAAITNAVTRGMPGTDIFKNVAQKIDALKMGASIATASVSGGREEGILRPKASTIEAVVSPQKMASFQAFQASRGAGIGR